jgi:hypothetical protein
MVLLPMGPATSHTMTEHEQESMFPDSAFSESSYEHASPSAATQFPGQYAEEAESFSDVAEEVAEDGDFAHEAHRETAFSASDAAEPHLSHEDAEQEPPLLPPTPVDRSAPRLSIAPNPSSLPMSVDDFAALEERVLLAVGLVRRERQARAAAEERAAVLQAELDAQIPAIDRLQQEVAALRTEREQVHHRVERLLSQLDALEL